jgi:hypothetical protein
MKRRVINTIGITLALAGAFGLGMWFMYFIMWTDVFTNHLLPMVERVFQ